MQEKYTFKIDFEAKQYIGIQLDWDYETRELRCSMKGYVQEALKELEYIATSQRHYNAPSQMARPDYGATIQYVKEDTGTSLTPSAIKHIERVVGKFLYYGRAIDDTMLHAIGDIASNTSKATTTTQKAVQYFLDYANSNPDAEILYRASDMILQTDSDAAYLVAPQARSRAAGYHFLGSHDHQQFNGPIHVLARIIKNVMASAMEAEIAAMYMNAEILIEFRNTLEDMGHP